VEREISSRVAKVCAVKFPHWRYGAGTDADFPQLRVELIKDNNGKMLLNMTLAIAPGQSSVSPGAWQEALFAPGDLILRPVMPTAQDALEFFSGAIEQRLLSNPSTVRDILGTLSEAVPLGTSVALVLSPGSAGNPRAVLPIEWSTHCHEFAESEFVIYSKTRTNEKIRLFSIGLSQPLDYKPNQKQFEGVGVQVNSWQKAGDPAPQPINVGGRSQVLNLTTLDFRLKESKPYFPSCNADATSTPIIAP